MSPFQNYAAACMLWFQHFKWCQELDEFTALVDAHTITLTGEATLNRCTVMLQKGE